MDRWSRVLGWVPPVVMLLAVAGVSAVALVLSHDPAAAAVACAAFGLSAFNVWRAELRGPRMSAMVVDHPTTTVVGNARAVRLRVSQPLVIENVGGSPSVLAGVEFVDPHWGAGNWWVSGVSLKDLVVPRVLRPHDPVLARITFDLSASGVSPRGERYDLAVAMDQLREALPNETRVRIVYTARGRTRRYGIATALSTAALGAAFAAA